MTKSKFIRIILSICLLGWLLAQVEHESLRLYLLNAEYSWYFASIAILPLAMWCGAYKWQILMANRGLRVGGILLISKFLIGVFFNNFLPSNVGGDIVRASLLTRHVGSEHWKIVWGSMLVERFTGLTGLFIALVIGAIFNFDWFVSLNIMYPLLLALIAFASIILVVFSNIQPIPTFLVARAPSLEKPVRLLQQLRDCMREFRNHRII
ncbi:MAG: flippase-like domain-containing protein, partial [Woeseiaceae bacterium]|nr:flippase-like domain-containing protein [Woeseiaceae bacterium]